MTAESGRLGHIDVAAEPVPGRDTPRQRQAKPGHASPRHASRMEAYSASHGAAHPVERVESERVAATVGEQNGSAAGRAAGTLRHCRTLICPADVGLG